ELPRPPVPTLFPDTTLFRSGLRNGGKAGCANWSSTPSRPWASCRLTSSAPSMCLLHCNPIWVTKTRTADEVRGQIEQILDAAKARRLREGDNPARWRGHLDNLLSKAEKKKAMQRQHFPA